jgi:hypothetical protein|tara:strand:- start:929 stop:1234 length:306 start_codon:yes stop_codon:yes gene_type:complete
MSVYFAVKNSVNVITGVKQVNSNVINVNEDGTENLFTDLSDHVSIDGFDQEKIGNKYNADGTFTAPGTDAQGNDQWFSFETGNLMQNTYNAEGEITGEEEV